MIAGLFHIQLQARDFPVPLCLSKNREKPCFKDQVFLLVIPPGLLAPWRMLK
jgi:hypothetical protein